MEELKIYDACLKCNYKNEKLTPILNFLYTMVGNHDYYLRALNYPDSTSARDKKKEKIEYIKKLLPILKRIVKDNKYEYLSQAIDFSESGFNLHAYYAETLELLFYPQELFDKNPAQFYVRIFLLCEKRKKYSKEFYPFPIVDYINAIVDHNYLVDRFTRYESSSFFDQITYKIAAHAYLNNLPIESTIKMILYLSDNYQNLRDYYRLNYNDNYGNQFKLECIIVDLIANSYKGYEKVIE